MNGTTSDSVAERGATTRLTESQRHRILANEQRRVLIELLSDKSDPVTLSDLATTLFAREADAGASREQQIRAELHHSHLPMFDEIGLVDYDPETNQVAPRPETLEAV